MSLPAVQPAFPKSVSGLQRSAALMRALGAKANVVWNSLSPIEAAELTQAMDHLPEDPDQEMRATAHFVRDLKMQAIPRALAHETSVWQRLNQQDGATVYSLIKTESPQVIALVLSKLPAETAAMTIRAMPRELGVEALRRLIHLGPVQLAVLKTLEASLDEALKALSGGQSDQAGHERLAHIFDRLDERSENELLSGLDAAEPGSGEKIRALMFTFDDLAELDPASLQTILASIDRAVLTIALKGAKADIEAAFLKNMTQRAGALLKAEIDASGPVRRKDVEAARVEILTLARTLAKRGDILSAETDDELIE